MQHARASWCPALALLAVAPSLEAAVIDDPAAGGQSGFFWEQAGSLLGIQDLGATDGVSGEAGTTTWQITLAASGFIDITVGNVYNRPPTEFALLIDDAVVPWTQSGITRVPIGTDPPIEFLNYFDGSLVNHLLAAGTHSLTLSPSEMSLDSNVGTITFGGVTPIPGPLAWTCMVAALGSLVPWARRARVHARSG
jgi:hypothetical protein